MCNARITLHRLQYILKTYQSFLACLWNIINVFELNKKCILWQVSFIIFKNMVLEVWTSKLVSCCMLIEMYLVRCAQLYPTVNTVCEGHILFHFDIIQIYMLNMYFKNMTIQGILSTLKDWCLVRYILTAVITLHSS